LCLAQALSPTFGDADGDRHERDSALLPGAAMSAHDRDRGLRRGRREIALPLAARPENCIINDANANPSRFSQFTTESNGLAPRPMKNPAAIDTSSIHVHSGTLTFADPNRAEVSDREPNAPQPRTQPAGPAARWWDSHPADLPQSTVLWIEDDPPGGAACDSTGNDTTGRDADLRAA
jgi:hypothetical protein